MLAERYAACAGAPARARGSCRAGGRAGLSSAFGRVPRCAARFETTASGHAVRSVSTRASGPVVDAAFGVEGGGYLEVDGGARLEGVARVGGAKNAVLALLAGALACREPVTIRGVPLLKDVMSMIDVLRSVGARVHIGVDGPDTVTVDARALDSHSPDPAAVEKLRASFFAAMVLIPADSWRRGPPRRMRHRRPPGGPAPPRFRSARRRGPRHARRNGHRGFAPDPATTQRRRRLAGSPRWALDATHARWPLRSPKATPSSRARPRNRRWRTSRRC